MREENIAFTFKIYDSPTELPDQDQELLQMAIDSKSKAYAPYSKFKVGAAVQLQNGKVILGNNQENASYPSGLCAERVAVFQAKALYPEIPIVTLAISSSAESKPAAPCGNCRQAIAEYEQNQESTLKLILQGKDGPVYVFESMAQLLPFSFDNSYLNSDN